MPSTKMRVVCAIFTISPGSSVSGESFTFTDAVTTYGYVGTPTFRQVPETVLLPPFATLKASWPFPARTFSASSGSAGFRKVMSS